MPPFRPFPNFLSDASPTLPPTALPIQLASKLTPEMEARGAELVARIEAEDKAALSAAAAAAGGAGGEDNIYFTAAGAAMAASRYERIGGHLDDFNRFVQNLTAGGGVLDPKVWGGVKMGQLKVWGV